MKPEIADSSMMPEIADSSVKPEITDSPPAVSGGDHGTGPGLAFELLESKFHPPVGRPGIVPRTALVERLATAQAPVVTVVAPPGFGKTTLLAQCVKRMWPRVAGCPATTGITTRLFC